MFNLEFKDRVFWTIVFVIGNIISITILTILLRKILQKKNEIKKPVPDEIFRESQTYCVFSLKLVKISTAYLCVAIFDCAL